MARIYQPDRRRPVPDVLDLHGGAWNAKDRHAEEPMDRALAASGVLVVAIDMTLAPEAPYPACVQDANYGVRWLKSKAAPWNGDPSTNRHLRQLERRPRRRAARMRPRDPRYNAIPLPEAPKLDATVAYVAMRSPISDPFARFQQAEKMKREPMMKNNTTFFKPWETIHERNPQRDSRAQGDSHTRPAAHHAGSARRQRAAGRAGEVRRDLQGRRRRVPLPALRRLRARVGGASRGRRRITRARW